MRALILAIIASFGLALSPVHVNAAPRTAPAAVAVDGDRTQQRSADEDAERYGEREQPAAELADFEGGSRVVIAFSGGTLLVVVLLVLLLL